MTANRSAAAHREPELVLNRFLIRPGRPALDLASGSPVLLVRRYLEGGDGGRWAECAGRLASLAHPTLARLVDFGASGHHEWVDAFEATGEGDGPRWETTPAEADVLLVRADRALRVVGCSLVRRSVDDISRAGAANVVVPVPGVVVGDDPGASVEEARENGAVRDVAVTWRPHDEYFGLIELLDASMGAGPQSLVIQAPLGSGVTTLFAMLAMAARRRGWVPISARLVGADSQREGCGSEVAAALRSRHALILQDQRRMTASARGLDGDALARFLAGLDAHSGRSHLILTAVTEHPCPGMALAPWPRGRLLDLAHNLNWPAPRWTRWRDDALRRASGWPGAFVRAIEGESGSRRDVAYPRPVVETLDVCEQPAVAERYGIHADPGLARARIQVRTGLSLAGRGRHADGARVLRGALGAMARRGADAEAGRLALSLADVLWRRGALAEARDALDRAHEHCTRARDTRGLIAGLVRQGWVAMFADRLAEAESVLLTAKAAAQHAGLDDDGASVAVSLAVCYRWQDRWAEAVGILAGVPAFPGSDGDRAEVVAEGAGRWPDLPDASGAATPGGTLPVGCPFAVAGALRALMACGNGDPGGAARHLHRTASGLSAGDTGGGWFADAIALRVHGALGDAEGALGALARGLKSARASREGLGVLELRVAHAEALCEAGERREASAALARLARWRRATIPALHRRRIDGLAPGRSQQRFAPRGADVALARPEALSVLASCREASNDRELVDRVCERVRKTLGAHAVAVYGAAEGIPELLGRAGAPVAGSSPAMVARVFDAVLPIAPERTALGIESAAPIRYSGHAVGAVYVRWTALSRPDLPSVRAAMTAASLALAPAVRGLLDIRRAQDEAPALDDELIGHSDAIDTVREQIRRAAAAPFPVLVQGESGTGKELVARALHRASPRRGRRFCAINCAAVGDELFEAELFGHARGAFTGALAERPGLFEEADGGTLVLDEVGELSARAQAKLLRAIQEGEIRRIGENIVRRVDVRIVAATNRWLADEASAGRFRQDLLFRLDVVRITLPPLRERPDDVAELAARFWRQATARLGSRAVLDPVAMTALSRYAWPGNVRELQNVLSAVAVRAPRRGPVGPEWLPSAVTGASDAPAGSHGTLAEARRQFDERYVRSVLARHGGQRVASALALGVTRQGLTKLMRRLGLA